MKKKLLAILLAALMLSAMAVVPAYADTAAAVPAGTDLFLDKNPGLENTKESADNGGWTLPANWTEEEGFGIGFHDQDDSNYDPSFGNQYLKYDANWQGGKLPQFTGLEGGRHYALSFYVRNAGNGEGEILIKWLKKNEANNQYGDYAKAELDYHWAPLTQKVGLTDGAKDAWTKLTYEFILPPNADGVIFEMHTKNTTHAFDLDNFSLLVLDKTIEDNIIRNGSFNSIRGTLDPMHWDCYKVAKPYGTPDDGKGGHCVQTTSLGYFYQGNVWLESGKKYVLTFRQKNTKNGLVAFGLGDLHTTSTFYMSGPDKANTPGVYQPKPDVWENYTAVFTCPGTPGEYKAYVFSIGINIAKFGGTVCIDDVVLKEADAQRSGYYVMDKEVERQDPKDYRVCVENHVENGVYWLRGTEADTIIDFAAVNGVHSVAAYAYHFPKAAGEKASLISAVYKENNGVKQLVNVKVTAVTAADTNPVALTHTVDVKEADASTAWVESFIWTDMTKLLPASDMIYTLGK